MSLTNYAKELARQYRVREYFHWPSKFLSLFFLFCVARVILPLEAVVLKCFSPFISKILTFLFQGQYVIPFIFLSIAITLLKFLSYILARARKPEDSKLPPYTPLEEHLKELQLLVRPRMVLICKRASPPISCPWIFPSTEQIFIFVFSILCR